MEIVCYEEQYKSSFISLNTDWILEYFGKLEPGDHQTFSNIGQALQEGAMIFFAVEAGTVLATCMTHRLEGGTWEICKLAANRRVNHKGAGTAVFQRAMDYAIAHGAKRLFLISNSKLKAALHIYNKLGFQSVALDGCEYERGDIAMEYLV